MAKSKIEWTENTWNPVTGCTKISDGCKNCYAAVMAQQDANLGVQWHVGVVKDVANSCFNLIRSKFICRRRKSKWG